MSRFDDHFTPESDAPQARKAAATLRAKNSKEELDDELGLLELVVVLVGGAAVVVLVDVVELGGQD